MQVPMLYAYVTRNITGHVDIFTQGDGYIMRTNTKATATSYLIEKKNLYMTYTHDRHLDFDEQKYTDIEI